LKLRTAHHAIEWLKKQPAFLDLATHADRLAQLQTDVDLCAPVGGLTVTSLEGTVLVLTTRSAAWAAKLRQFEPSLVSGLTHRGWKVSRIRIRPQPNPPVERPAAAAPDPKAALSEPVLDSWSSLLDQCDDGPLRTAIAHFLKNQRPR
jgi:Dna[CI] antecedent, DciA